MSEISTALTTDELNQVILPNQKKLAWKDIKEGFEKWRIWFLLAYQDIKLRYRRSVLGPFWITLSMAITVYSMGYLYGHLFRQNLQIYYPFLVAGMLTWSLISNVIMELAETFFNTEGLIKQVKLPYSIYLHRVITRNFIIFFHNIFVIFPIYFLFSEGAKINLNTLLLLPGLLIIYFNALCYGTILAILGARYRDISQLIKSLIQVIFFVTPVMWSPLTLPADKRDLINLNPFYAFLELVRAPLIGHAPTLLNFMIAAGVSFLGFLFGSYLFIQYRSRIIYWL